MKSKKLWEILVPTKFEDNQKPVSLRHHKNWDRYVLSIAGGQTILRPAIGHWMDDGKLYEDRVIPVRISCSEKQINLIIKFTAQHYRQIAVMAYEISSNVKVYRSCLK